MSDLIEKVARAILGFDHFTDQQWAPHWKVIQRNGITPPKAKRAILAVLEHYSEPENVSADMRADALRAATSRCFTHDIIAAALRAELERLRGEK